MSMGAAPKMPPPGSQVFGAVKGHPISCSLGLQARGRSRQDCSTIWYAEPGSRPSWEDNRLET
jgi:hypothetical protein